MAVQVARCVLWQAVCRSWCVAQAAPRGCGQPSQRCPAPLRFHACHRATTRCALWWATCIPRPRRRRPRRAARTLATTTSLTARWETVSIALQWYMAGCLCWGAQRVGRNVLLSPVQTLRSGPDRTGSFRGSKPAALEASQNRSGPACCRSTANTITEAHLAAPHRCFPRQARSGPRWAHLSVRPRPA